MTATNPAREGKAHEANLAARYRLHRELVFCEDQARCDELEAQLRELEAVKENVDE